MPQESGYTPRVLVVDDEQRLTDLLRLELNEEGYEVDIAGSLRLRLDP